jgi:hypothetical protein
MGRRISQNVKALITRLSASERRIGPGGTKKKFRRRAKRVYVKKTDDEKAAAVLKRRTRNIEWNADLQASRLVLREEAENLRNKYGQHGLEYYVRCITHSLTARTKGTQKRNEWNVFQKYRMKQINEGTYHITVT